jgi:osmotically-inducible protein OsmY
MTDRQLRQNVIDELDFEPSIDSAEIGVTAESGVVTLTGHVATYVEKLAAERAAWRVKGVKAIAQQIQVRLPGDKKTHDDEIAQRALNVLAWSASVPGEAVKVRVQDGCITLTGTVGWNYQRQLMESAVRRLTGVKAVVNDIALEPTATHADIKDRIARALERHADVEAERIVVTILDGGRVCLNGIVDNQDERLAVERAAWAAPGVHAVEDHLRIA